MNERMIYGLFYTPAIPLFCRWNLAKGIDTAKLVRTLTEQILYEIWISRCKHTGKEQNQVNVEWSLASIRFMLLKIWRVHYRYYATSLSFNIFEDKFCINKAICSLDYHRKLNLHLSPKGQYLLWPRLPKIPSGLTIGFRKFRTCVHHHLYV